MIRPRSIKRIKKGTPGGRTTIHFKKFNRKHLLNLPPKIERELLKAKVRK
jgi:hypothetical protein